MALQSATACLNGEVAEGVRIPSESGHPFRREGGHHSDVKAATHSETKAATHFDVKAATFLRAVGMVAGLLSE